LIVLDQLKGKGKKMEKRKETERGTGTEKEKEKEKEKETEKGKEMEKVSYQMKRPRTVLDQRGAKVPVSPYRGLHPEGSSPRRQGSRGLLRMTQMNRASVIRWGA
jgi:hypothetical protein